MSRLTTPLKDWRAFPPGKEKYQLYLASREWAVLKEAVRKRSGGQCERCRNAPGEQTHHQTYERIYQERLEDLLHVCPPCHEFLSGRRSRDPVLDVPPRLLDIAIRNVYLAGKITRTTWRDQIVERGWSFENHSALDFQPDRGEWLTIVDCLPIPDGRRLSLRGPYWRDTFGMGGHGDISREHGPHSFFRPDDWHKGYPFGSLVDQITKAIIGSDLFFAWIDSNDCFGTLVEVGFASRVGHLDDIVLVVATPEEFEHSSELWLALQIADLHVCADSPGEAWNELWREHGQ